MTDFQWAATQNINSWVIKWIELPNEEHAPSAVPWLDTDGMSFLWTTGWANDFIMLPFMSYPWHRMDL